MDKDPEYPFNCVGPGWHQLIAPLVEMCKKHNVEINQVKEKFGALRFYVSYPDSTHAVVNGMWPQQSEAQRIQRYIEAAETLSSVTCEECGKPGVIAGRGWVKCYCPEHRAEQEAEEAKRRL